MDNLSTQNKAEEKILSVIDLDKPTIDLICGLLIGKLNLDKYICQLYTTIEIVEKIKDIESEYTDIYNDIECRYRLSSKKVKLDIEYLTDTIEMTYFDLICLCRIYIRTNYSAQQVAEAFSNK